MKTGQPINFTDDREGSLFTAIIHRKEREGSEKIIALMQAESRLSAKNIAKRLDLTPRAIEKQIAILKIEWEDTKNRTSEGGTLGDPGLMVPHVAVRELMTITLMTTRTGSEGPHLGQSLAEVEKIPDTNRRPEGRFGSLRRCDGVSTVSYNSIP